jgi:acid stress-induced BolA-like protein IbaG/YrbA
MTSEELKATLERLPLQDREVRVEGRPGRWLAIVISTDYDQIDDHERQTAVWTLLHETYGLGVSREVESVYTFSRAEVEELEAEATNDELTAQAASGS